MGITQVPSLKYTEIYRIMIILERILIKLQMQDFIQTKASLQRAKRTNYQIHR